MTARAPSVLSLQAARAILGVAPGADERELRAAYREAAKRAHPDRPGGDAALFRDVLTAYRLLQDNPTPQIHFPPAVAEPARVEQATLTIDTAMAFAGGTLEMMVDARKLRLTLPAGLREDDKVRVEDVVFRVAVKTDPQALVRGDDLWLTARLDSRVLAEGGRIEVATAIGPRLVWISTKAAARGLVRLPGQGLPARGAHRQGDLFLRLEAVDGGAESAARSLLKRFAAAWAA
ncbi:DnaJ-class molecular chaperone with C-terminal Zn finger domain [Caulobacter sp. AP07]|uniref:DnaJ C-terminal domain-containing protein n=1 Tax=Caulobacter sp. AP07 TaxID=1144304 RepID=UPI0002720700|nr:DnaJ C-terminal domain-containing protein [Caulobacter sp. AP07]EJL30342.1 DnaJ-class molecular chaperone with C-terminal Zn finger domain [Caulobacter sp. AP07]